jgi:insertion element IS1 protein InsB
MIIEINRSTCGSHDLSKNGKTRCSKQSNQCRDHCQFVEDPQWKPKDQDTQALVNLLLLEKFLLARINRSICISDSWLQCYVKFIYESNQTIREITSKKNDSLFLTVIY